MMSVLTSLLALALTEGPPAAGPLTANPAPQAAAEADQSSTGRKVKLVCKSDYVRAGTRFAKQKCVEVSAYKRQQEIDRQAFEEVQKRPQFFLGN